MTFGPVAAATRAPLACATRRVPQALPSTVYDAELDVAVAFAHDAAPCIVTESEVVIATLRGRAIGLSSVDADMQPASDINDTAAIATRFDVEALITITDRRLILVGSYGWSASGVVDMTASTFLLATYDYSTVALVEARRSGIRRRIGLEIISLTPATELRLSIFGASPQALVRTVAAPMIDNRLSSSTRNADRDRLSALQTGAFDEHRGRVEAWLVPSGVSRPRDSVAHPAPAPVEAEPSGSVSSARAGDWWSPTTADNETPPNAQAGTWWADKKGSSVDPDFTSSCTTCGAALKAGAQFCGGCGNAVPEARA